MTNEIDWCARLRDLASGKLTGEIPAIEYSLAADEIERLRKIAEHVPAMTYIAAKEAAGYGTKAFLTQN